MIRQARHERAFPGEGALDLPAMLSALPAGLPMSLEAPVDSLKARLSPLERARRARRAMQSLADALAARPAPRPPSASAP